MLELFGVFFKLGILTIGGGLAMIPILTKTMVEDKKWFSEDEMVDIISICQSVPGVVAINMATYVGFKRRGLLGSFVATVAVTLPSLVIIILIAKSLAGFGDNRYIMGALGGLRAAAVGLVAVAVYTVGKQVVKTPLTLATSLLAFILVAFCKTPVPYLILAYVCVGILYALFTKKRLDEGPGGGKK